MGAVLLSIFDWLCLCLIVTQHSANFGGRGIQLSGQQFVQSAFVPAKYPTWINFKLATGFLEYYRKSIIVSSMIPSWTKSGIRCHGNNSRYTEKKDSLDRVNLNISLHQEIISLNQEIISLTQEMTYQYREWYIQIKTHVC